MTLQLIVPRSGNGFQARFDKRKVSKYVLKKGESKDFPKSGTRNENDEFGLVTKLL